MEVTCGRVRGAGVGVQGGGGGCRGCSGKQAKHRGHPSVCDVQCSTPFFTHDGDQADLCDEDRHDPTRRREEGGGRGGLV